MDCRQAAEILSAAAEGELLDAAQLTLARQHCLECAECRRIAALVERSAALPRRSAPGDLVTRLENLAGATAREIREAHEQEETELEEPPVELEPKARKSMWRPITVFASVAALLLVALTGGTLVLASRTPTAGESTAETLSKSDGNVMGAAPQAGTSEPQADTRSALKPAPSYVVFDGGVWLLSGPAVPSGVTTAGAVVSDLGTGTSESHDAFISADGELLFVAGADGSYLEFAPVVRTMGRSRYRMVTDVPVTIFGQWPTLPGDIPTPTEPDGAPVFSRFGFDDRNVDVYALIPHGIEGGFAIAPNTAAEDPAAGNPNWTWWEKLD